MFLSLIATVFGQTVKGIRGTLIICCPGSMWLRSDLFNWTHRKKFRKNFSLSCYLRHAMCFRENSNDERRYLQSRISHYCGKITIFAEIFISPLPRCLWLPNVISPKAIWLPNYQRLYGYQTLYLHYQPLKKLQLHNLPSWVSAHKVTWLLDDVVS